MEVSNETPPDRAPAGKPGLGGDLVIPVLALAFAGYFFWSIDDLEWEARANGTVIGTILVALVVLQVGITLWKIMQGQGSLGVGRLLDPRDVLGKRIALTAILCLFVGLLNYTGATLGLFVMMVVSMWLLGVRDWRALVGISTIVAGVVYVLFILLLKAKLPQGPAEKLLALIPGLGG
jgi:hypothetical protein